MVTGVRDRIEREVVFAQSIERVWAAITEADSMRRWFCSQGAEIDLRPGGVMLLKWNQGSTRAIIAVVDPLRQFAFRWRPRAAEDPDHALGELEPQTLVTFTLEAVAEGTRLRLVESGFAALSEERRATAFAENDQGWNEVLADLGDFLDSL